MLRQAVDVDGASVYVYRKSRSSECIVALDFVFDGLFFVVLESGSWAVDCLGKGKFLIFNGSELLKIER